MTNEMNNSVYGNPSSLTIHNEKNTKTGKIFQVIHIFSINVIIYFYNSQIKKLISLFRFSIKYDISIIACHVSIIYIEKAKKAYITKDKFLYFFLLFTLDLT